MHPVIVNVHGRDKLMGTSTAHCLLSVARVRCHKKWCLAWIEHGHLVIIILLAGGSVRNSWDAEMLTSCWARCCLANTRQCAESETCFTCKHMWGFQFCDKDSKTALFLCVSLLWRYIDRWGGRTTFWICICWINLRELWGHMRIYTQ